MNDLINFINIVSENTSGAVATVAMPLGQPIKREQTEDMKTESPKVLEYGNWENSALTTSDKLKKKRGETKVVKSVYGENKNNNESKNTIKNKLNVSENVLGRFNPADQIPKGIGGGGGGGTSSGGGGGLKGGSSFASSSPSSTPTQDAFAQAARAAKSGTAPTSTASSSPIAATSAPTPTSSATISTVMRSARTGGPLPPRTPSNVPQYTTRPAPAATPRRDPNIQTHSRTGAALSVAGHGAIGAGLVAQNNRAQQQQDNITNRAPGEAYDLYRGRQPTASTTASPAEQNSAAPPVQSAPATVPSTAPVNTRPQQQFSKAVTDLAQSNNIPNPNLIKIGQTLKLPDGSSYTVKQGDTLSRIASALPKTNRSSLQSSVNSIPATATSIDENGKTRKKIAKHNVKEDALDESDLIINPSSLSKLSRDLVSKEHDRRDHEVGMALSDLYQAGKNAATVFSLLKNVSEDEGIEGWVQEKIIKAADYLNTIREYLEGRQMGIGEAKPGLWANIHAKRERIKSGSGERMRKPGTTGAPTAKNFKAAQKTSK